MKRWIRTLAAATATVALLTGQVALSAYACTETPFDLAQRAVEQADLPECHKPTPDALCDQHCQYGDAAVEKVKAPDSTPAFGVLPVRIEWPAPRALPSQRVETPEPTAGPPPHLRTSVLRL